MQKSAKLFINGRSQAVRLPKELRFAGTEILVHKVGEAVILFPSDKKWKIFLHGLNNFSSDFMKDGRNQGKIERRDEL